MKNSDSKATKPNHTCNHIHDISITVQLPSGFTIFANDMGKNTIPGIGTEQEKVKPGSKLPHPAMISTRIMGKDTMLKNRK